MLLCKILQNNVLVFSFQSKKQFDRNSNLTSLENRILRDISELHVTFDKVIDLLIKNQTMNITEKLKTNALQSKIFEKDIKQLKPLATESDIEK